MPTTKGQGPAGSLSEEFLKECDEEIARLVSSPRVIAAQEMESISHADYAIRINTVK